MIYSLVFLGFLRFCLPPIHEEHTAIYTYHLDQDQLSLHFYMDYVELQRYPLEPGCDQVGVTALCTFLYLKKKAKVSVNGSELDWRMEAAKVEDGHLGIWMKADMQEIKAQEIQVDNGCFLEFEPTFKNRLIFRGADLQKSYLLDQDRQQIRLEIK